MAPTGFKELNRENFLQRDPTIEAFFSGLTEDVLLETALLAQAAPNVPEDVRALFEASRGAMCYGFFFYPLFVLGMDQLYRVAETAARSRVKQLGGDPRTRFAAAIEFLAERGAITPAARPTWDFVRHRRNESSHPKFQQLVPPGFGIDILHRICDLINSLFRPLEAHRPVPTTQSGPE